jgi:2Fe-2S ferredoxin
MKVIKVPQKKIEIKINTGENLMTALIAAGLPVASSCHGDGICSMCKVTIEGQINLPNKLETETLKRNKCTSTERLSCQIAVTNDISVCAKYW